MVWKRRALKILHAKKAKVRKEAYLDLLAATNDVLEDARRIEAELHHVIATLEVARLGMPRLCVSR